MRISGCILGKLELRMKPGADVKYSRARIYPMSTPDRLELERQVSDLLKWGFIERSKSQVFFSGISCRQGSVHWKKRMVYDFRSINKILEEDSYDLPTVQEITEKIGLQRPTYLSSFDLSSAYSQVLLDESSTAIHSFFMFKWQISTHCAQRSVSKILVRV